jgi:CheY-like chemotaxis protein
LHIGLVVSRSTSSNTVLIVEDDADSRVMLATMLTLGGYRTITAANGAEALAVASAHRPCLILLDLHMPVMDGQDFRRAQIADPAIKDIPVILVTAHNNGRGVAQQMGVTCCITKPLQVDEVLVQVARHCEAQGIAPA